MRARGDTESSGLASSSVRAVDDPRSCAVGKDYGGLGRPQRSAQLARPGRPCRRHRSGHLGEAVEARPQHDGCHSPTAVELAGPRVPRSQSQTPPASTCRWRWAPLALLGLKRTLLRCYPSTESTARSGRPEVRARTTGPTAGDGEPRYREGDPRYGGEATCGRCASSEDAPPTMLT